MSILLTAKEMDGLSPEEQAKKAITHVLRQIRDEPYIGWYLGMGTQSFSLLTEAYATLLDLPIEDVRKAFACKDARNPKEVGA